MSDTANFHVIARRPLLGLVNETDLYGDILFVAATHDGVWALDVTSDSLSPIAHYEITGDSAAYDLWRTNDTLYVADGRKIRMLKWDSAGFFTRLATFGPNGSFCVSRKGNYVAVGAQGIPKGTVMVYQCDYLTVPVAMWQSNNAWDLQDIEFGDLRDDIIYLCAGPQNLLFTKSYFFALQHAGSTIIALDSFSVPGIIGFAQANINNLDSRNDTLFISTTAGLNNLIQSIVPVLDASGLPGDSLHHIADIRPGLWHFDVALMHGTPYLAMSSEWLGVLISDVSQLQPEDTLQFLETGGWCQRSYIHGDTIWACMRGYGLVAYERDSLFYHCGYMNDPKILHIFTQFVMDVAFVNDTLIVLSTSEIYNLAPWLSGGVPKPAGNMNLGTVETIRAINTNVGKRIVAGLSDLIFSFREIALYDPFDSLNGYPLLDIDSTNSDVNGLLITGDTLFCGKKIGNNFYLAMFKVENDDLILIDTVPSPGEINGISCDGTLVVACCGLFRFDWYYIDENTLVHLGSEFDWFLSPQGVYLKNNLVYVADRAFGLRIYQLSQPPEATLVAECKGTGGWVNLFGSTGVNVGDDGMICLSDFQAGVILIEAYDSTLIPTWENDAVDHPQLIIAPNPFRTGARLMIRTNNKLEDVDILIYTLDGKILHSTHLAEIIPGNAIQIPDNQIPSGMFICSIYSRRQLIATGKLILY
jgi:hypothetical protein